MISWLRMGYGKDMMGLGNTYRSNYLRMGLCENRLP